MLLLCNAIWSGFNKNNNNKDDKKISFITIRVVPRNPQMVRKYLIFDKNRFRSCSSFDVITFKMSLFNSSESKSNHNIIFL